MRPPPPDTPDAPGPSRFAATVDRLATAAARRTTPRRALTAFAAVSTLTVAALLVAGGLPGSGAPQRFTRAAGADPIPTQPPPTWHAPRPAGAGPSLSPPPPPSGAEAEFVGWAVLDRRTGSITGSDTMTETSTTASMIKAWLVADYLRRTHQAGDEPSGARFGQLTLIIRDSNNEHSQQLFQELGEHASIARLIDICGLTDSSAVPHYWSNTRLSPRDTARMGACLADGRAAGPEWTDWLLSEMRQVRGVGDFGIRHAFPADRRADIAIKNGWVVRDDAGEWHVNCLAVADGWAMGVLTRYPAHLGYEHGAEICRTLARQNLSPA